MDAEKKIKVFEYVYAKADAVGFMGLDRSASSKFQGDLENDPELIDLAGEKLTRKYIKDSILNEYAKKNRYITEEDILSVITDISPEDIIGNSESFSNSVFHIRKGGVEYECVSCSIREWQTAIKRFGYKSDKLRIAFLTCGGVPYDSMEIAKIKKNLDSWGVTALIVKPSQEPIEFNSLVNKKNDNSIYDELANVCNSIKELYSAGPLKSNDSRLGGIKSSLHSIANYLKNNFQNYRNISFSIQESDGAGYFPTIPYICILPPGQKVNDGVYFGLCFGRGGNGFVLGCAESDTNKKGLETVIRKSENLIPRVDVDGVRPGTKYNNTFSNPLEVVGGEFSEEEFKSHIRKSLDIAIDFLGLSADEQESNVDFNLGAFKAAIKTCGMRVNDGIVDRFCSLLLTKPFVILTGLSGSGKTKLAQVFCSWMTNSLGDYFRIIPVGSDWTNRDPLLGYPDALNPNEYTAAESGVVDLILKANSDPSHPYFIILDEMNLSHVERYFADFLSVMESGQEIRLHDSSLIKSVPRAILMPRNVFIIGTVNIDETTYMFSPKVLDRAGVIEFRVNDDEMLSFLEYPSKPDLEMISGLGFPMAKDFVRRAVDQAPGYEKRGELSNELIKFFKELKIVGAEFGYRTAYEINRFAGIVSSLSNEGEDWKHEKIVDAAIVQKLLPKLHGSQRKLSDVIKALAALCVFDNTDYVKMLDTKYGEISDEQAKMIKYPVSFEKIHRMYDRLKKDGFTSFAEA